MALDPTAIANIKGSIKGTVKARLGTKTYTKPGAYVDNGDGTYRQEPDETTTTLNFEDLDEVIDAIVEEICDQLSASIVKNIQTTAQVNITTGVLANGGATAGFGGPGAGLMVTG
jgi:hypothetical protein